MQHNVGELCSVDGERPTREKVVKFPNWIGRVWDELTFDRVSADIAKLTQSGVPIAETSIHSGIELTDIAKSKPSHIPEYILVQERLKQQIITIDVIRNNESVRNALRQLYNRSIDLAENGDGCVDMLGFDVINSLISKLSRKPKPIGLSNIFYDENSIKLIDTVLYNPELCAPFMKPAVQFGVEANHACVHRVLQTYFEAEQLRQPKTPNLVRAVVNLAFRLID